MGAIQDYEPAALTAELWALAERIVPYLPRLGKMVFLVGAAYPSLWVQFFVRASQKSLNPLTGIAIIVRVGTLAVALAVISWPQQTLDF